MTAQEQITKLQGLLARIQKNAAQPRASAATAFKPASFAPPVAAQRPIASAPPPAQYAPPPPMPYAAPPPAVDQSVDDLLNAVPDVSPLPLEVDVPFESVAPPPVAEIEAPVSEPFPLVASSTQQAQPSLDADDQFDSEVSEVRVTTGMRDDVAEVTVAAIEAEAEPAGAEELSEDDLVEVMEGTPPPGATDVDIDFEDEPEQAPASSQRPKVASSMDEALAAAADQLDAEHEVPLKTPPPESGPQAAPAFAAPPASDVDALLGQELDIPTRAASSPVAALGPTPEQLGQTIDLEEARGPELELAEHQAADGQAPAHVEELEVALPGRGASSYDDNLMPPPEALDELEAHRRRLEEDIAPPPESLGQYPSVQPGAPAPQIIPFDAPPQPAADVSGYGNAPAGPEIIARPAPMGSPEVFASVRDSYRPSSFVELLDASLSLNGE